MQIILFLLFIIFQLVSSECYTCKVLSTKPYKISTERSIRSSGNVFVLGLFKSAPSSRAEEEKWYLGIWPRRFPNEVVWVANRDNPLSKPLGTLKILNTNIYLLDQNDKLVWGTNTSRKNMKKLVLGELLDSGNFVLRMYSTNNEADRLLWQSFDFPTDTLVPDMKLGWDVKSNKNRVLQSWRGENDPSSGKFTYGVELYELPESYIRDKGVPTLRSGPWKSETDQEKASEGLIYGTFNITVSKEEVTYYFSISNESFFSILRITHNGILKRITWIPKRIEKDLPGDICDHYNVCGPNGVCDLKMASRCNCIQGFHARNPDAWKLGDWELGCVRKTSLICHGDGFVRLRKMKLPNTAQSIVDKRIGLKQCRDKCLKDCNCTAYSNTDMQNGGSGCVIWVGELLDLRKYNFAGQDLFVRLHSIDIREEEKKNTKLILILISVGIFLLGCCITLYIWKRKKRPTRANAATPIVGDLQFAQMDLENVSKATQNFSDANKIGQGGFGIVYKGRLRDGQEIAVKRLSKKSVEGIDGFINEMKVIASVQHINLVQILGYCFEEGEMILIYEFLINSSLDTYIFSKTQRSELNWEKRFQITNGIARGLLYLHQDSRVRIIHRDLKPSNVLLDKDMIPKISDFGMAKLFKRNETEANTTNVVGTYGYMPQEYAINGIYSIKSDVYSFGVLILEIISGRRNTEFFNTNEESLLNYIWRHWKEGKGLEIVDPVLVVSSSTFRPHEVLRCIHIGLLCVQEYAEDRPTMSSVILMLTSETTDLEQPNLPGYLASRSRFQIGSSSTKQPNEESCTVPEITNSIIEGR